MTQRPPHNKFLFGSLLAISFLTVVALWIPSAKQSFTAILSGVGSGASSSAKLMQEQWRDAQDVMKSLTSQEQGKSESVSDVKKQMEEVLRGTISINSLPKSSTIRDAQESRQRKECTRAGGVYEVPGIHGICTFANGSECDAEMFLYNKCHIGQYSKAEDGIPQKPDFIVLRGDGATIVVMNRGRIASGATILKSTDKTVPIPPLAVDASFVVNLSLSKQSILHIDPEDTIQEIIEENNTLPIQ